MHFVLLKAMLTGHGPAGEAERSEDEDRGLTLNLDRKKGSASPSSPVNSVASPQERRARVERSNSLQRLLSSISSEREREKSREGEGRLRLFSQFVCCVRVCCACYVVCVCAVCVLCVRVRAKERKRGSHSAPRSCSSCLVVVRLF